MERDELEKWWELSDSPDYILLNPSTLKPLLRYIENLQCEATYFQTVLTNKEWPLDIPGTLAQLKDLLPGD